MHACGSALKNRGNHPAICTLKSKVPSHSRQPTSSEGHRSVLVYRDEVVWQLLGQLRMECSALGKLHPREYRTLSAGEAKREMLNGIALLCKEKSPLCKIRDASD
jgi:hypothetical protein